MLLKIGKFELSLGAKPPVKASGITNRQASQILASYDAAQTNASNIQHWAQVDNLSADEAASPQVRELIRNRARYEYDNSSYLKGITKTERNYIVGTGPRLQIKIPAEINDLTLTNGKRVRGNIHRSQLIRLAKRVETAFKNWAREIKLSQKIRLIVNTRIKDGEVFTILTTRRKNWNIISLDLRIYEAQHVCSPFTAMADPLNVDGIKLDIDGYPETYSFLKDAMTQEYINVPAKYVIHFFGEERPQQHRGISETAAGLSTFAQMRDYTVSVLGASRLAAAMAMICETVTPLESSDGVHPKIAGKIDEDIAAFEFMPIQNNGINFMPSDTKLKMIQAEQPTNTYPDFKAEMVNEYGRGRNMPYNLAAGNSKDYNYASGRLDYQFFDKNNTIEKDDLELDVINPIYAAFHAELSLDPDFALLRDLGGILPYSWIWDGVPPVDQLKAANAQGKELQNGTTTEAIEAARKGLDWEDVQEQRIAELANKKRLIEKAGLTVEEASALNALSAKADSNQENDDEKDEQNKPPPTKRGKR